METNIVDSRKKNKAHKKRKAIQMASSNKGRRIDEEDNATLEMDEDTIDNPLSDSVSNSDADEESDVSDYDMDDVSDDESEAESGSEDLDFSDPEESEGADSDLDEDVEEGCKILSPEDAERIVKDAMNLSDATVRRLVVVYGSFIRRAALKQNPSSESAPSEINDATKAKRSKRGRRKQRQSIMASRELSDKFRHSKNRYAPSSVDVYNYVALEAFSVIEKYLKQTELSFSNARIVEVAVLFRRFLSSALVQLGFHHEDMDLCRCALHTLGSETVMPWVVALKSVHKELIKIACSLLTHHNERAARVYALQLLQRYMRCLSDKSYHCIQISQPPSAGTKVERLSSQQSRLFRHRSVNFMLNRSYRTQISASSVERTMKNYGLFKLSQNCLAELYNEAETSNLYTFAFKSIRDLGINVRRQWLALNDKQKRTQVTVDEATSHSIVLPVYSWGFVEAVNVWVAVLVRCRARLEALVYPLVVVITAAIKVKLPHIDYIPFVLHMLTAQNQLADGLEKFIPLASYIFNMLEQLKSKDVSKMWRTEAAASRKMLDNTDDIMVRLRLSKKQLHSSETYKTLYRHIVLVLADHVGLVSLHPSFPEFSIPIIAYLKRYLKSNKVGSTARANNIHYMQVEPGFRDALSKLIGVMDESAAVVRDKRSQMEMGKQKASRLKLLHGDAKHIPAYQHRIDLLVKYQHISKEKVAGTLSAMQL